MEASEGIWSSGAEVTGSCKSCDTGTGSGTWVGPLQKQYIPLTSEPSLYPTQSTSFSRNNTRF